MSNKSGGAMRQYVAAVCGIFVVALGGPSRAQEISAEHLFPYHLEKAKDYRIYVDAAKTRPLELDPQPRFVWSNPRRGQGQVGHLFLWNEGKTPAAVMIIFSNPWSGNDHRQQRFVHELHSLSESTLVVENDQATAKWVPTGGIEFLPVPGKQAVAENPNRRRLELRQIMRGFEAHTIDAENQRWPLRLLNKEIAAYDSPDRWGALHVMVGDAGADPELLLLVEAAKKGDAWAWRFAPVRMTDHQTFLSYGDQEVWSNTFDDGRSDRFHNADFTYFRFPDVYFDATVPYAAPAP